MAAVACWINTLLMCYGNLTLLKVLAILDSAAELDSTLVYKKNNTLYSPVSTVHVVYKRIPNFECCKFFWTKKGGLKPNKKNLNGLNQQAGKENITCIFAHLWMHCSILARQQRFQYKEKQLVILREVVTRFLKSSFWFTAAAAGRAKWKKHKSAYCHFCLHGLLCCDRL